MVTVATRYGLGVLLVWAMAACGPPPPPQLPNELPEPVPEPVAPASTADEPSVQGLE